MKPHRGPQVYPLPDPLLMLLRDLQQTLDVYITQLLAQRQAISDHVDLIQENQRQVQRARAALFRSEED